MIIGSLQLELRFFQPQSLKEKRRLLKSLIDRLRKKFNVSVSEVDGMDLWQASVLAIAAVGKQTQFVNQVLDRVIDFIHEERNLEITKQQMELF